MAEWAKWMVILTVLQALLGAASILLVLRSLGQSSAAISQATQANKIAQANHISERRPWLEVEGAYVVGRELTDHGLRFDLQVQIKNVGSSPARNLWVDLVVEPEPKLYPIALANSVRERVRTDPIFGQGVVFPGSTHLASVSVTLVRNKIERLPVAVGTLRHARALIVGVVRYETMFEGDPVKQSGFSFRTLTSPDTGIVVDLEGGRIAVDALALKPTEGGWYAV